MSRPPKAYKRFIERFAQLGEAWDLIAAEGEEGPLDKRTQRLIKLGIAMGAMRTGSVHSGVRKARAMGISKEEIEHVVALAAGTLGMPSTVANYQWVCDVLDDEEDGR